MSFRSQFSFYFNSGIKSIANSLNLKLLPVYYNDRIIFISKDIWESIRSEYENYLAVILQQNLKEGDVFFDIGAHYGLWSLYSSMLVGNEGKVLGFEPSDAYQYLEINFKKYKNCTSVNQGISDEDNSMTFYSQGCSTSGSLIKEITDINKNFSPDIEITEKSIVVNKIDSYCKKNAIFPDLIKIDVEGHEYKVIEGASQILNYKSPKLIIEIHPPQLEYEGKTDKDVLQLLKSYSYEYKIINRNKNSIYTVFATRNNK